MWKQRFGNSLHFHKASCMQSPSWWSLARRQNSILVERVHRAKSTLVSVYKRCLPLLNKHIKPLKRKFWNFVRRSVSFICILYMFMLGYKNPCTNTRYNNIYANLDIYVFFFYIRFIIHFKAMLKKYNLLFRNLTDMKQCLVYCFHGCVLLVLSCSVVH